MRSRGIRPSRRSTASSQLLIAFFASRQLHWNPPFLQLLRVRRICGRVTEVNANGTPIEHALSIVLISGVCIPSIVSGCVIPRICENVIGHFAQVVPDSGWSGSIAAGTILSAPPKIGKTLVIREGSRFIEFDGDSQRANRGKNTEEEISP